SRIDECAPLAWPRAKRFAGSADDEIRFPRSRDVSNGEGRSEEIRFVLRDLRDEARSAGQPSVEPDASSVARVVRRADDDIFGAVRTDDITHRKDLTESVGGRGAGEGQVDRPGSGHFLRAEDIARIVVLSRRAYDELVQTVGV